ncbi:MAG: hypothetical protein MUE41_06185 [Gemmatimonadaceae bacterium]|nr:hypothetical protein [Gemmatimonadaceae bacterium]
MSPTDEGRLIPRAGGSRAAVDRWQVQPVMTGWRCRAMPATMMDGTVVEANDRAAAHALQDDDWLSAHAPGTVAGALREAGRWSAEHEDDLDARDWLFETDIATTPAAPGERCMLEFDGLGVLCTVWLNGTCVGTTDNQFIAWQVDVTALLAQSNRLTIRCHALAANLARGRGRARWRTSLVDQGALRHVRASVLGRMPGWWPHAPVIGPWRPVRLVRERVLHDVVTTVRTSLDGDTGVVAVTVSAKAAGPAMHVRAGSISVGAWSGDVTVSQSAEGAIECRGRVRVPTAPLWWPHTHGTQPLFDVVLHFHTSVGLVHIDLGRTAFRTVDVDPSAAPAFGLRINGVPVFCRGPVWAPLDICAPHVDGDAIRCALEPWRDAGANMVRIPGWSVPESDAFHSACDALGLLVWQDAMFASMDYPAADAAFVHSCAVEVRQVADRLAGHPSTTVFCGSSEVAQQAAFMGQSADAAVTPLFSEHVPRWIAAQGLAVPYVCSSPWGGMPPTRTDVGVTHYYGVGAFRRPLDDARRAAVGFAAECLGFSHVADDPRDHAADVRAVQAAHGVPRDPGAAWDFADVREHYQRLLGGGAIVDARDTDPATYRAHGRWTTAHVLRSCFAEWRRVGSPCRGALVWLSHDVRAGDGWGVRDHRNAPKDAFRALAEVWQPLTVLVTDEGQSGLLAYIINERSTPHVGALTIVARRADGVVEREVRVPLSVPPRGATQVALEEALGEFLDLAGCYRFGPPRVDRVVLTLTDEAGVVCDAMTWPARFAATPIVAAAAP